MTLFVSSQQQGKRKCPFPYIGNNCAQTFGAFQGEKYKHVQYAFLISGVILLLVACIQMYRVLRYKGSCFQRKVHVLIIIGAWSFILRSYDPSGFNDDYTWTFSTILADTNTCVLFSLVSMYVIFWIALLKSNSPIVSNATLLKISYISLNALIWITLYTCTICASSFGGVYYRQFKAAKYIFIACVVVVGSVYSCIHGIRVYRKLKSIKMGADNNPSSDEEKYWRPSEEFVQPFNVCDRNFVPPKDVTLDMIRNTDRVAQSSNTITVSQTTRVIKILIALGIPGFVALVIAIYRAASVIFYYRTDRSKWYLCATRNECKKESQISSASYCHYIGLWVFIWIFHKIKKKAPLVELSPSVRTSEVVSEYSICESPSTAAL